jgi:hypothetical protein
MIVCPTLPTLPTIPTPSLHGAKSDRELTVEVDNLDSKVHLFCE